MKKRYVNRETDLILKNKMDTAKNVSVLMAENDRLVAENIELKKKLDAMATVARNMLTRMEDEDDDDPDPDDRCLTCGDKDRYNCVCR
jgi:hypothetical protein